VNELATVKDLLQKQIQREELNHMIKRLKVQQQLFDQE
jgi:hypothetical protein